MDRAPSQRIALEPAFVSLTLTGSLAAACVHGVALALRAIVPEPAPPPAVLLTYATLAAATLHATLLVLWGRRLATRAGVAVGVLCAAALLVARHAVPASALALGLLVTVQALVAGETAARLEPRIAGLRKRRPWVAAAWAVLGVALLVQSARLSTYMADASVDYWLTTRDPLWAQHMCMPAYIEGADLQRQHAANVYDVRYYAMFTRDAAPRLNIRNMGPWQGDPYQYPPPFLVLPRLALALSNDYLAIRTAWYVLQLLLFLLAALTLSAWIGGSEGWTAALLVPALWLSLPAMQSLQYGQFHMAALSLALLGMVALDRGRHAAGGALLAAATLAKVFPGILVLWLLARRRWREAGWTLGWMAAITGIAFLVLGPDPFKAFVTYQMPRLANGLAFDFTSAWPEFRTAFMTDNLSPGGSLEKLGLLGVPGMSRALAAAAQHGYSLVLLVVTLAASRLRIGSRRGLAVAWLALLNLAALQSYGGWGDYITLGSAWLLTLLVHDPAAVMGGRAARRAWLVLGAVLFFVVPGVQPIPKPLPLPVAMTLTLAITLSLLAMNARMLLAPVDARRDA